MALAFAMAVAGCKAEPAPLLITSATRAGEIIVRDAPLRTPAAEQNSKPERYGPPKGTLSLREAVELALAYSPATKAAFVEIDARRADATQASYRVNPQLSYEIENFGGNKSKVAFGEAEQTATLSQVIELGDKRVKRLAAANLETSLAGWDFETTRVVVAARAADLFVDALAAQERWVVLREFAAVAEEIRSGVEARVQGGKSSPIDLDRAVASVARANALAEAERGRFDAARARLSNFWGVDRPTFASVKGRLGLDRRAPSLAAVRAFLENNPQLARWSDEVGRRYAALDLERAKSVPDITVGAGVRQLAGDNATALVASVSLPLQIFDANQGNIAAAERRAVKAEFDAAAARNELVQSLVGVLGELSVANAQVTAFESKVLPAAQSAFDRTRAGYDGGKFDFLGVLDTQRTLFEARLELLNARAEYEKARVKAEALIGRSLNDIAR
ncbi:TolC family protein [Hyphomicrobium sp.]|jgi:cobalt-zinc-cadmium efflux system outer membrane protein|uniref:TolC family protein n=1 Tax=Hyphomicrobium sp. TaxID=82 RepID=UPI003564B21D